MEDEPVFGLYMQGVKQSVVLAPALAEKALASPEASHRELLDGLLERVFGDRGSARRMKPADHSLLHESIPRQLMQEPFVTQAAVSAARMIERETPELVSFCRSIVDQKQWERGSNVEVVEENGLAVCCVADFFALVRGFVGTTMTAVFMGQAFVDAFPGLLDDLWRLDSQYLALSMGLLPRWFPLPGASAAHTARDRLLRALAVFHGAFVAWDNGRDAGPEFRDLDDVAEPIKQHIRACRDLGLRPAACAPAHLALLWAINVNSATIVAWNLLRICADQDLLAAIRREIQPHVRAYRPSRQETGFPIPDPPRVSIDLDALLASAPLLKASYYETLRLDSASLSVRELTSELTLVGSTDGWTESDSAAAGYRLQQGDYVTVAHGVHQNDGRCFPEPARYDPTRFVVTDSQTRAQRADMRTIRPFGSGASACKGQAVAERTSMAFVAAIVSMWDIQPADGASWTIPGHKPASAAFLPDRDIRLQLRQRV